MRQPSLSRAFLTRTIFEAIAALTLPVGAAAAEDGGSGFLDDPYWWECPQHPDETIDFPSFRYIPWADLDSCARATAVQTLRYDRPTWDLPGSAPVESLSWDTLSEDVQRPGASSLGFDDETWDCYVNHYQGYSWSELVGEEVQWSFADLGWTERSWEGTDPPPASEGKNWTDLTFGERAAAEYVCYFQCIWDGLGMTGHSMESEPYWDGMNPWWWCLYWPWGPTGDPALECPTPSVTARPTVDEASEPSPFTSPRDAPTPSVTARPTLYEVPEGSPLTGPGDASDARVGEGSADTAKLNILLVLLFVFWVTAGEELALTVVGSIIGVGVCKVCEASRSLF